MLVPSANKPLLSIACINVNMSNIQRDRQTDRQIDRQMDGRMDRQTDTERERDRQIDRETDRETDRERGRERALCIENYSVPSKVVCSLRISVSILA